VNFTSPWQKILSTGDIRGESICISENPWTSDHTKLEIDGFLLSSFRQSFIHQVTMSSLTKRRHIRPKASKLLGHARSSKNEVLGCAEYNIDWKRIPREEVENLLLKILAVRYELVQRITKSKENLVLLLIDGIDIICNTLEDMKQWVGDECTICTCLDLLDSEAMFVVLASLKIANEDEWYNLALNGMQSWDDNTEAIDTWINKFVEDSKLEN